MSETDDTDVLLIIPPNFFSVKSSDSEDSFLNSSRTVVQKPVSCTAQVLDKLVNQVHSLESRLEGLEIDSSLNASAQSQICNTWNNKSIDSRSVGRNYFTFPRRRRRKIKKSDRSDRDDLSNLGWGETELKYNRYNISNSLERLINDTQSMDGDISSIISTPSKNNDKLLLNEIDEFLTKVESNESPESMLTREGTISPDEVIKATGDYISQKLNPNTEIKLPSGRSIPATILDKYIYLVKNSQGPIMSNTSASDLNNEIQKEKSSSMRRLNFTDSKDIQPTSTPKQNVQGTSYADSFKPSSNKIYKRASRVLEQYKQNSFNSQNTLQDTVIKKEEFKMPQMRPFQDVEGLKMAALQIDSVDTDMLSLSELWGERGDNTERANNIKLEEERLKREHCEVMIQQLQKKILDQQEKLAVAMKVDKAKDTAITKLKEAWLRLTNSLSRAEERHKAALDKMVQEVENFKNVADDAQNKTNHFEKELYKALDLAHDYQEKCKEINNDKLKLQEDVEKMLAVKEDCILSKEKEIETLKDNYETVMRLNKHSTEHASDVEQALEEEKKNHEETKIKLKELQNKIQLSYSEKQLAEQERDLVKEKVNEERSRCNILESQLAESQNQIGELLKRCDLLENDTKTLRHHLELQKTELRSHYQQQLEDAVRSKLQQFQQQLDAAQRDLDDAAASREAALVDGYSKQMARIEEQNMSAGEFPEKTAASSVNLDDQNDCAKQKSMESPSMHDTCNRHKLEVSILEEKQREEIKLYRLQLAQASEKIGLLENKVDSWKKRRGEMAAQLHAVMQAQWTQALRILTRPQQAQNPQYSQFSQQSQYPQHLQYPQHSQHSHYPQHSRAQLQPATKYSQLHVDDYASDTALTGAYREEAGPSAAGRGPDDDLQRYIRELLLKKPNFEEFEPSPEGKDLSEEPTSDRPDRADRRDRVRRSLSKPPWKA